MQHLGGSPLGVFGGGHLGQVLAQSLLAAGLPRQQLVLCHGGNPATQQKLVTLGLQQNVASPGEVAGRAKIIFYTVRPQSYRAIEGMAGQPDLIFASFLAGVPLDRLPLALPESQKVRIITSGPETIRQHRGIAALFPENSVVVSELLAALKLRCFALAREEDMDAFTAFGPCLQLALAEWGRTGRSVDETELLRAAQQFNVPQIGQLLAWARSAQPENLSARDLDDYLAQAATPGGVTEAILTAIRSGLSLPAALAQGVTRSRQLRPQ
ncbi:MAG TPA: NAD(P)-binding domain-containing protein [Dongiaceae bacterium]|nr:NAD(P)-binding domain-containing protein [Dongiaceae bacterium]